MLAHMTMTRLLGLIMSLSMLLGCQPEQPQPKAHETIDSLAERFLSDLGQSSGEALTAWLPEGSSLTLTRRCPDCPKERRVEISQLSSRFQLLELGDQITSAPDAESMPSVSALRAGQHTCSEGCCDWSLGLLDHGAMHLERACFIRDERGAWLSKLTLIQG